MQKWQLCLFMPQKSVILWSQEFSYKFFHSSRGVLMSWLLCRSSLHLWSSWRERALVPLYAMLWWMLSHFYFFSKMITPKSIFWTMEKEDEWAGLLQHLQNMPSYPLTAGCWVTYKTITEKQEWAGMSSSVLGPVWQLLSPMTAINLHVTALPSFPNKRKTTLFQMDFTPRILFSNEFSWLKLLRHQQTFGPSQCTPSERRKRK